MKLQGYQQNILLDMDIFKKSQSAPQIGVRHQFFWKINPRQVTNILQISEQVAQQSQNTVSYIPAEDQSSALDKGIGIGPINNISENQNNLISENNKKNFDQSRAIQQAYQIPSNEMPNFTQINDEGKHAANQKKSQDLQQKYKSTPNKNQFFEQHIKNNIPQYCYDKYFHYAIQTILDHGPLGQKCIVMEFNIQEFDKLASDCYGSKVLVKCLETAAKESILHYQMFVEQVLDCSKHISFMIDKYSNLIVQKSLEIFKDDHLEPLLLAIKNCIFSQKEIEKKYDQILTKITNEKQVDLCYDQYGCLIIQKLIEIYDRKYDGGIKKFIGQIIDKIVKNGKHLSQHSYSNYVIQHMLALGPETYKNNLYEDIIIKNFMELSVDKFASNVVEKAVTYSNELQFGKIWAKIQENQKHIVQLMNNQYANFVMQRIFEKGNAAVKQQLGQIINQLAETQQLTEYGLHVWKFVKYNSYPGNQYQEMSKSPPYAQPNAQPNNYCLNLSQMQMHQPLSQPMLPLQQPLQQALQSSLQQPQQQAPMFNQIIQPADYQYQGGMKPKYHKHPKQSNMKQQDFYANQQMPLNYNNMMYQNPMQMPFQPNMPMPNQIYPQMNNEIRQKTNSHNVGNPYQYRDNNYRQFQN